MSLEGLQGLGSAIGCLLGLLALLCAGLLLAILASFIGWGVILAKWPLAVAFIAGVFARSLWYKFAKVWL